MCQSHLKRCFWEPTLYLTYTTFYGASIGEVRFGGTFRISDLQYVRFRSDFEILTVNFKKYMFECSFISATHFSKSENSYVFAFIGPICSPKSS